MTQSPTQTFSLERPAAYRPRIVIVGGGFGGLYTALYLQKYRHLKQCSIRLIEPRDRFLFTPLLYEVLTEELLLWEVAPTYQNLLMGTNIQWQQDRADHIDLERQRVTLCQGDSFHYDYLVVATGAQTRQLPIPGINQHGMTFRSLEDVITVKARLDHLAQTSQPVAVTVIGAGASGVELATKVADRLGGQAQVRLVDRGNQILKPFPPGLQRQAMIALKQRNVELYLQTQVNQVGPQTVQLDHVELPSHLTLWATGAEPVPWLGTPVSTNDRGQVLVRSTLQLEDYFNVFVVGDVAAPQQLIPNTAQAAYQAAATVASNLANMTRQRQPQPFRYLHLGDMLALGKGTGGVWSFGISLGGKLGGFIRRAVYIHRLPTNHHRLKVARRALRQLGRAIWPFRRK
ncbi:fad-dependent pyridine nucleotide-disulfide oxidoreductase [Leptolyngbya sp. Heron Island J]|uniref:NAD(P)/FAD-dependent oxidoreductase n=1 Tax=Leptolyngbya sp. Heron Island J TaxID=1385935 RepID=UPI0003B9B29D|nr:FAD-dependent oxidoreductase [Leptolyngbya sp. Heron Island J]ESA32274.1 fad-dependent pyridine nucleotide-disulfide oxidoreductase [Leptolyngbya sp. Heron Island J]